MALRKLERLLLVRRFVVGRRDRERKQRIREGEEKPFVPPKEVKVSKEVKGINELANAFRKIGRMV